MSTPPKLDTTEAVLEWARDYDTIQELSQFDDKEIAERIAENERLRQAFEIEAAREWIPEERCRGCLWDDVVDRLRDAMEVKP